MATRTTPNGDHRARTNEGPDLRLRVSAWGNRVRSSLRSSSARREDVHHLVPHPRGWAIQPEAGPGPLFVASTKDQALDKALAIARRHQATLVVHRTDGTIQEHRSYARE